VSIWAPLLTIAGVHALALAIPGPNVIAVSHTALSQSRRAASAVAIGVAAGALIWSSLAAFGLAAALAHASGIATGLRIAGAAYLVVLGVRHIRARPGPETSADALGGRGSTPRLFARGLAVNLTNPKSMLFFASVFAALLPPDAPLALRAGAVAVVVVDATLWHLLLAFTFSTRPFARVGAAAGGRMRKVVGGVFVLFGIRLAFGRI